MPRTKATSVDPADKVSRLSSTLKELFVERDDFIDAIFHGLISKQHVVCFGPPGTAKSKIADMIRDSISGIRHFMIQLNGDTLPEELTGPLDFKRLTDDNVMVRKLDGYIGTAHIALIDEILSGNSIIRESLRRIMNEREIFLGDGTVVKCPLITMIGGTNDAIEEAQDSLVDRFVFRIEVKYIKQTNLNKLLYNETNLPDQISIKDIEELQKRAENMPVPENIMKTVAKIRSEIDENGSVSKISDRRYQQMVGVTWGGKPFLSVIKASAALHGHAEVQDDDLAILTHCLWTKTSERNTVKNIVMRKIDELSNIKLDVENDINELDAAITAGSLNLETLKAWVRGMRVRIETIEKHRKSVKSGKNRDAISEVLDNILASTKMVGDYCKSQKTDIGRHGPALAEELFKKVIGAKNTLGVP